MQVKAAELAAKLGVAGMAEKKAGKTWFYGFIKRQNLHMFNRKPSTTIGESLALERKMVRD